jgi:hypothetical protein
MSFEKRLIALSVTLLCLSACNGSDNSSPNISAPGHQTVQSGWTDLTTQCDSLRKRGRHDALQALGIDMLEKGSNQIVAKMTAEDDQQIQENASIGTEEASKKIDSIIASVTQAAKLNWGELQLSPETHRKLLLGNPDYLDRQGNFSVGSTTPVDENTLKNGGVDNVYLVVGPDSFSDYTIKIEVVISMLTETVSMLDYVDGYLLPSMCEGVATDLDSSAFNSIPVGAQN